ncbi:thiamine ABC transporter ATP-binding protein [Curvivirga aplysinae]|uniref:thiamine ABC transporter ATP-binding protein n=1 Tax=Curvivirga aplysinae TaxID=2529852 RepID=UPI0012BCEFB4|nr:thiamine ABC transporter ATP-binding protein [Curvivirga aplysinae]MTI11282.1 thiamine ABC transporter ATP-binding protein [Curvivirga aplysinae]
MIQQTGLILSDIQYNYKDLTLRYDFNLKQGDILALIGPSGGGKTTLLDLIAGFLSPHQGTLSFQGNDLIPLAPSERPITMLFQHHNLFPHLSITQNVAIGIDPGLKLSKKDQENVANALSHVGLDNMGERLPATLSGGQRQRVALARALVRHKPLLLLDEPFSALDPSLSKNMMRLIKQAQEDLNLTVIYSTHSPMDSLGFADQVAYIKEGRIEEFGKPEDILNTNTQSPSVKDYLGN